MEARKNKNIEQYRKHGLFFNIGLAISMLMVISAFEMRFEEVLQQVVIPAYPIEIDHFVPPISIDIPALPVPKKAVPIINAIPSGSEEIIPEIINPIIMEPVGPSNENFNFGLSDSGGEVDTPEIFLIVEKLPEPRGGFGHFYKYIQKNLKYPAKAKKYGVDGKMYVSFVVDRDGSLTDIEVIRGIGFGCDEEAVRVISSYPTWNPGKQRGVPVKVKMVLPLIFNYK